MDDKISVLMCVYNTEREYLIEAINSILNQTYTNFEFIIIDDHSDSMTENILHSFSDPRIKIYRNENNYGLTKSLNRGLRLCTGKYLARMDSDDVADEKRFEEQIKYIKKGFYVIGSLYEYLPYRPFHTFITEDYRKQKIRMIFANSGIVHSSAFIDLEAMKKLDIMYDEDFKKSQDFALWCDFLTKGTGFGICPKKLIKWRVSENQISVKNRDEQTKCREAIRKKYINHNIKISEDDLDKFTKEFDGDVYKSQCGINAFSELLMRIIKNNKDIELMEQEISLFWAIQTIYCVKNYKSLELLRNRMVLRILKPTNFIYILRSISKEFRKI